MDWRLVAQAAAVALSIGVLPVFLFCAWVGDIRHAWGLLLALYGTLALVAVLGA